MEVKYAICNEIYTELTVYQAIEHAASLGYHGVELAPFTLSDDLPSFSIAEQKKICQFAKDNGIEIMGLHWLLLKPEGLHLTTSDKNVRQKTFDFFRKLIEINSNVGGKIMTLGSPKQRSIPEGEDREIVVKRTIEFFQKLTPDLESSDSILALEPLEDDFTNFMISTEETCKIIDKIGSKAFGITLDTHFLRWESQKLNIRSIAEIFKRAGSYLVHLHIQDENRLAPGMGNYDFTEFNEVVKQIGWTDYISMETYTKKRTGVDGNIIATAGLEFFRKHF